MRRALQRNGLVKKLCCAKKSIARIMVLRRSTKGTTTLQKCRQSKQRKPQTVDCSANEFVYAIATPTFSGPYPTCGDTLAFKLIADRLQSTQMVQVFKEEPSPKPSEYPQPPVLSEVFS
jgi:hypothetical protein